MSSPKPSAAGADWSRVMSDPDLSGQMAKLLQVYREAPPEKREEALLQAMREIKGQSAKAAAAGASASGTTTSGTNVPVPPLTPPAATPPFETDIFTPNKGEDRRRYPRLKCFVAVELRVEGNVAPIWGNLANTSLGGCFVETAFPVPNGAKLEIGLWVANGKIWVKGVILNGVVTRSNPCFGIRIKFAELEPAEREILRQFLKFVESTTKGYQGQHGYLAQIKR